MTQFKFTDFTKAEYEDLPDLYEAVLLLDNKETKVGIDLNGETDLQKVEQYLNTVLSQFSTLLPKAKQCIAKEFLKLYNDNWRFSDDDEEEDKPELTEEEFMEALTLDVISFLGAENVDFFFNDNDMFFGHALIASDFDGKEFNYAQMFG
ncbi:MAG: DUF2262 domain-containing protein [Capnocytophaga sp.]|nr:DUF2262 domain-containing protein [Capnocytophaga sp.]